MQSPRLMNAASEQPPQLLSAHGSVNVIGIPAFDDNLIWVIQPTIKDDNGFSRVSIVDPGNAAPVIDACRRNQWIPQSILLTHHHGDHTGGVPELQHWMLAMHPSRPLAVYGPAAESIPAVTHPLSGGEEISLADGLQARVLAVPGHTRGHLAYLLSRDAGCQPPALFSGDVLFGLGCGRLFEGTAQLMYAALATIKSLDADTRIYCAHEYTAMNLPFALKVDPENRELLKRAQRIRTLRQAGESTLPLLLSEELATNPFLRCDQPALIEAACLPETAGAEAIFAALRTMRDNFKSC